MKNEEKTAVFMRVNDEELEGMKRISGANSCAGAILSLARRAVREENARMQRTFAGLPETVTQ